MMAGTTLTREYIRAHLTLTDCAPYFRIGERTLAVQTLLFAQAGLRAADLAPYPILPSRKGQQGLGEACRGRCISQCLAVFGCDEQTLVRIACRDCPD